MEATEAIPVPSENGHLGDAPESAPTPAADATEVGITFKQGGQTWILPSGRLLRSLDEIRDSLFDESVTRGTVPMLQVRMAALVLLSRQYDLPPEALAVVVSEADDQELADAVMTALFGQARRYNYTEWVVSALRVNGLDPSKIRPDELDAILRQLVLTGMAADPDEFISSAKHAAKRRQLSGMTRG